MASQLNDRSKSVKLSEVLTEIGVNEKIIKLRRKCAIVKECTLNLLSAFSNQNVRGYMFGSQSEGSTTIGLSSDVDVLLCHQAIYVIADWADWKPGVNNLLMVQDEATSPGYCLLQLLRKNIPQAATYALSNGYTTDNSGRILCKNSLFNDGGFEQIAAQNGPAHTVDPPGRCQVDGVPAVYCAKWPVEARDWMDRRCVGNWPSSAIKRRAISKGCFLVPVASKCNTLTHVEWRISTSFAERLMMFDLNITQLQCYVMLKYISKTFFAVGDQTLITSFMCKCTLFHCVENTPRSSWCENNMYPCLLNCIIELHERVRTLNCPHCIIPANNLMANRITADQQCHLLGVIERLIQQNIDMFYVIKIDDLGERLRAKMNNSLPRAIHMQHVSEICIVANEIFSQATTAGNLLCGHLNMIADRDLTSVSSTICTVVRKLQNRYEMLNALEKEALAHISPLLCALIGALLAVHSVQTNNTVSPVALSWFTAGFKTDVASSRLKLAAAFFCSGDVRNAELILNDVEHRISNNVVRSNCTCHSFERKLKSSEWYIRLHGNTSLVYDMICSCVIYIKCETPIIPSELRHELARSTAQEVQNRSIWDSRWMNSAVVDSLPYLYFLQYKVYKHQQRQQEHMKALSNLLKTVVNVPNLGHRETAWNLLGLCMQHENKPIQAAWCYERSLVVRPHNNAANFHQARLHAVQNSRRK